MFPCHNSTKKIRANFLKLIYNPIDSVAKVSLRRRFFAKRSIIERRLWFFRYKKLISKKLEPGFLKIKIYKENLVKDKIIYEFG